MLQGCVSGSGIYHLGSILREAVDVHPCMEIGLVEDACIEIALVADGDTCIEIALLAVGDPCIEIALLADLH